MSFLIGVLCGVILTIVAVYGSITIYLFEPPAEVKNEKEEKEHGIQASGYFVFETMLICIFEHKKYIILNNI